GARAGGGGQPRQGAGRGGDRVNYSETLLEHFRAPRNVGMMRNADAVGESQDSSCGDLARFYLRVLDGRIAEARFQTYGCGPSIAASSLATELVRGRPAAALADLTPLPLPPPPPRPPPPAPPPPPLP